MSSKKNYEEEENEMNEVENDEEENEENEDGAENIEEEEEEKEYEGNLEEEEKEEEENKKEKDDLDERIANIGDASLKIQNIVSILSDFKEKREEGKSRSEYMSELKELCKSYYEYNDDICDLIFNLFPPNEAIEFMEASDSQKVLTIRTNSLKTKRRELAKNLISRGVNLDPLAEWSKVGLKIYSSTVPIGATPEYLSGQYMLQSASSFLPVLALDPHPGDKILDMCASPGGKTTYIGQLMKNEGLLVANDFKKERIKSLFFNVHRMGIKNSIITNYDGREFAKLYNKFDRVLLDAPCSGLGVISKDKSVKMNRSYKEILNNSRLQKELILAAIDSCNTKGKGEGTIVYSTCTISVEENEWVIDYALKHRYVKCVEVGIEIGEPGLVKFREKHFHPSIVNTRRVYPHIHNIDGFFIAKLKKYNDGPKIKGEIKKEEKKGKKDIKNKKENNQIEVDDDDENDLGSEPEDIQDQLKKGKLKNYIKEDNKKKKKEDDDEDDGIFSGEEYEKVEEDVEKDAKKKKPYKEEKNIKKDKNIKKGEKEGKNNKQEKNNKKEEKEKNKSKEEKNIKKEKKNKKEKEKIEQKKEEESEEKDEENEIKEDKEDKKNKKNKKEKKDKKESVREEEGTEESINKKEDKEKEIKSQKDRKEYIDEKMEKTKKSKKKDKKEKIKEQNDNEISHKNLDISENEKEEEEEEDKKDDKTKKKKKDIIKTVKNDDNFINKKRKGSKIKDNNKDKNEKKFKK